MHSLDTKNEFLKLRVQGYSFARISAQLRVSKPTLIAWSRRCQAEIQALKTAHTQTLQAALAASNDQELNRLTMHLKFLEHELLSRSLRPVPTSDLESLASRLKNQLQKLQALTPGVCDR